MTLRWNWRYLAAALLGAGLAFLVLEIRARSQAPAPADQFSRSGKDLVLLRTLRLARKTIYLRSQTFELTPAVDLLVAAQQDGIHVEIDLPLAVSQHPEGAANAQRLMNAGATIQFSSDPDSSFEGTYALVDNKIFFYAASPLSFSPPGSTRSYVVGSRG